MWTDVESARNLSSPPLSSSPGAVAAQSPEYGFGVELRGFTMERARTDVTRALASEGFEVLSAIDLRALVDSDLRVDVGPYLILIACHPELARRTIAIEPYAGLLTPCNVTLWQRGGDVIATIANPAAMIRVADDLRLAPIWQEGERRLRGALARILE